MKYSDAIDRYRILRQEGLRVAQDIYGPSADKEIVNQEAMIKLILELIDYKSCDRTNAIEMED